MNIDELILKIAEKISRKILPSKLYKLMLILVIVSNPIGFVTTLWVPVLVLSLAVVVWMVTQFAYSKQIEDETLNNVNDEVDSISSSEISNVP